MWITIGCAAISVAGSVVGVTAFFAASRAERRADMMLEVSEDLLDETRRLLPGG